MIQHDCLSMHVIADFKKLSGFGSRYLSRYKRRFVAGIMLGVLFGAFTGSFVYVTKLVTERVERPVPAMCSMMGEELVPGGVVRYPGGETPPTTGWLSEMGRWLDPWLPRKGVEMTWEQLIGGLLLVPLLAASRGLTGFLSSYCMAWVSERVVLDLRVDLVEKLHSLSLDYFMKHPTGEVLTQINSDTGQLQRTLALGFSDLIKEPFTLASVALALVLIDWWLACIAFVFMPLCLVPILLLGGKIRKAAKSQRAALVTASSLLVQTLANLRAVKAFGLERVQAEEFREQANQIRIQNMKSSRAKEMLNPVIESIAAAAFGCILVYAISSDYEISDLAGFLMALILSYTPVKKLASLHVLIQQSAAGTERLEALFAEVSSVGETGEPRPMSALTGSIRFEGVGFGYSGKRVLEGFSFEIKKGMKLGIVGESGSGKSTIVNLLFRFYDPTSGRIEWDGGDIRDFAVSELRSRLSLVSQEILLFNRSIEENIRYGRLDATRDEIVAAAKLARAHDFIEAAEEGYSTVLGEFGAGLSGGQKQRIAIARALLRKADVLVLDEATASLDSRSEAEILDGLAFLPEGTTAVMIAHRLSTLCLCDEIIVLEDGGIRERGGFQELLAAKGLFYSLAEKQGIRA